MIVSFVKTHRESESMYYLVWIWILSMHMNIYVYVWIITTEIFLIVVFFYAFSSVMGLLFLECFSVIITFKIYSWTELESLFVEWVYTIQRVASLNSCDNLRVFPDYLNIQSQSMNWLVFILALCIFNHL